MAPQTWWSNSSLAEEHAERNFNKAIYNSLPIVVWQAIQVYIEESIFTIELPC